MPDDSRVTKVRHTVEALVGRKSREKMLIGVHWPKKAAVRGEVNLTTPAGKWSPAHQSESLAMDRRVRLEYGLAQSDHIQLKVVPLGHEPFTFPEKRKTYSWSWVELLGQLGDMLPNERDVASHGWYSTLAELETAVNIMHESKATMFRWALGLAIAVEPLLKPYHDLALPLQTT